MKFREIASRLTGFSVPVFGVSWTPPQAEVTVARRVIAFLEDRRVLFADESIEVPSHCVSSVLELRHYLTSEIQQLTYTELCRSLRAMRAACRKFMESVDDRGGVVIRHGFDHGHWASWRFGAALGELRATFGRPSSAERASRATRRRRLVRHLLATSSCQAVCPFPHHCAADISSAVASVSLIGPSPIRSKVTVHFQ